ncbi:MAG TPA: alkaline phosphatase family protein [Acidimicrobiales bacterium]|nr:alkaline phosphatase family protein [Acidimicrobiales bacterium]
MSAPLLPDYGGASLEGVVPAILGRRAQVPAWLPAPVATAEQVVLLVLDGLGWDQLQERAELAPTLASMTGGPVTTVAPSTTATALTSLTTGARPAAHGVLGYRVRVLGTDVLNVLRWRTVRGEDARDAVPPEEFQRLEPFAGTKPPVVTRAEFGETGFTRAHLAGVRMVGWRVPSTLVTAVGGLLAEGAPFVYAYYDGVDKVAHEYGFGPFYDAELVAADRLAADLLDVLPRGAAVAVCADHGQIDVGERVVPLHREVMDHTGMLSGEGRFRWLHARPGCRDRLADAARRCHGGQAWVRTREEAAADGWFGGSLAPESEGRLGDVVLAAREPVAFLDPADTGEIRLRCRHGSLTRPEMLVPLVGAAA